MKVFYKHFFDPVKVNEFEAGASIEEIILDNAKCNKMFLDVFVSNENKLERVPLEKFKHVRPKKDVYIQAIPGVFSNNVDDPVIQENEKNFLYKDILPNVIQGAGYGAAYGLAFGGPLALFTAPIGATLGLLWSFITGGEEVNAKNERRYTDLSIRASEKLTFAVKSVLNIEQLERKESKQMEKELISNIVSRGSAVPEVFGTLRVKPNRITPLEDVSTRSQKRDFKYYYEMVLSIGDGQLSVSDIELNEFTEDNEDEDKSFETDYSNVHYVNFLGNGSASASSLNSFRDAEDFTNDLEDVPSAVLEGTIFIRIEFDLPETPEPPTAPTSSDFPDAPDPSDDDIDPDTPGAQLPIDKFLEFNQHVQNYDRQVQGIINDYNAEVQDYQDEVKTYQDNLNAFEDIFSRLRSGANNLTALVTRSIKNPLLNISFTPATTEDLEEQTGITGATMTTGSYTVDGQSFYGFYLGSDGSKIGSITPFSESIIQSISQDQVDNETITVTLQPSYAVANPDLAYIYIRENTITDPTPTRYELTKTSSNTYTFSISPTFYLLQSTYIFNLQFNDGTFLYSNPTQSETPDQDKINAFEINPDLTLEWSTEIDPVGRFKDFYSSDDFINGNAIISRQLYRTARNSGITLHRSDFAHNNIYLTTETTPNGLATFEELGFAGDQSLLTDTTSGGELLDEPDNQISYDKLMVLKNSNDEIFGIYGIESSGVFGSVHFYSFYGIHDSLWFRERYNFVQANETDTMKLEFYDLGSSFTAQSPVESENDFDALDNFFTLETSRYDLSEDAQDAPNIYSATSGFVREVTQGETDLTIITNGEALDADGMIDINGTEYAYTLVADGQKTTYTIKDTPLSDYVSSQNLVLRFKKSDDTYITETRTPSVTRPNVVTINRGSIVSAPTDLSEEFLTTNNPAWICLYILRQWYDRSQFTLPFNDVVDVDSFVEWGNYCSSNSLQFNGVFDYETNVFDALNSVASVARCQIVIGEEKIRAVIGRAQSVIKQYFHSRNILEYSAAFDRDLKPHAITGTFINSEKGYYKDTHTIYLDGYDATNAKDIQTVSALGLTTQAEVEKHLNIIKTTLEKDLIIFNLVVSIEALVSKIGDFVGVNFDEIDDSMMTSSFVEVVKDQDMIIGFSIDQNATVDLEENSNYVCQFLKSDNTITPAFNVTSIQTKQGSDNTLTDRQGNTVTDEAGEAIEVHGVKRKTLILETPLTQAQFDAHTVASGDLILFGKTNTVVKECLIKEVTINEDLTVNLTLVEYDEELYP